MEKYSELHTDVSQGGKYFQITFVTNDKNKYIAMQDFARKLIDGEEKAIAEHELHIKQDYAREIIADLENSIDGLLKVYIEERAKEYAIDTLLAEYLGGKIDAYSSVKFRLAELKKKYTKEEGDTGK